MAGLAIILLAGCGSPKPADTVNEFLTAVKEADVEKAVSYVEANKDSEFNFSDVNKKIEGEFDGKEAFNAIAKSYKFEEPKEVSKDGDKAKVKVKITSVDMKIAISQTISEVMPMAFAQAFSEDQEKTDKSMQKLMEATLLKNLSPKNATMDTREVTLNLKKDKEGNYKVVSDDKLMEAIFANAKDVEEMFKGLE
ncbi:hypothetical protein [Neobacillus mesonae]|uniref:hypothetical protein n=1 Tax=Neobacillus mesonae TaxID=1193713 RepID=UPI00203BAF2C|nr:hypothetical protein [Neobacillus mesonae]MCM3569009.1 hypothetical protein [Neobacillus mesonae]